MTEPILIWGAGAIGGTIGAYWARAGIPVTFVDVSRHRCILVAASLQKNCGEVQLESKGTH